MCWSGPTLDLAAVEAILRDRRMVLQASVGLSYLERGIGLPLPPGLTDRLAAGPKPGRLASYGTLLLARPSKPSAPPQRQRIHRLRTAIDRAAIDAMTAPEIGDLAAAKHRLHQGRVDGFAPREGAAEHRIVVQREPHTMRLGRRARSSSRPLVTSR